MYLGQKVQEYADRSGRQLVVAWGSECQATHKDVGHLQSNQEEADTKMILHDLDATANGATQLQIQFIWTETSREENFLHSINRRNFRSRLTVLANNNFPINSERIDSAKELFTNILNDICASYFRLSCTNKT